MTLPREYVDFLSIAGRGFGQLFVGTDIYFPRLLELKMEAEELVNELSVDKLPRDSVVFCMHQGYEINFFLAEGDDRPVFQVFEGQEGVGASRCWDSFSGFVEDAIKTHLAVWPNLNKSSAD